jgi:glyoxylase-like metal-dependent hydrolase (beta-lactamase superfamily II)
MRRHLLPILLVGAAMNPLSAQVSAAKVAQVDPIRIGQLQVWTLRDGQLTLQASYLKDIEAAEAQRLLGGQTTALTPVNAYLVKVEGKLVLVDTGLGQTPGEDAGHLLTQLAGTSMRPEDIDVVVITHYHFDHIQGLLKADGSRAFPKAQLRVPLEEHTYWMQDPAQLPERFRERSAQLRTVFGTYEKAGALHTFKGGETLVPGLQAVSAFGHTAGHTVYVFRSGKQELWCLGDLIHFGAVQFERPKTGITFDLDGAKAVQARLDLFRQAAQTHAVLAGAHLPRLVCLEAQGEGYLAKPFTGR